MRYKLFGTYWDGIPIYNHEPLICERQADIRLYSEEYDLMDWKCFVRKVPFSALLMAEKEEERNAIIQQIRSCDIILIDIDFFPAKNNVTIVAFLIKRLKQMYSVLEQTCNKAVIMIATDNSALFKS